MPKVIFNNTSQTFYPALKKEVEKYFKDHQIKPTGNIKLYVKTFLGIGTAVFLYLFLLLANYSITEGILLSVFFGFALVFIAFNTMHDACHGSFSGKKWVNLLMGYTMNALGGSAFLWKIKHNVLHHTYTNVEGIDDDISQHPFLRFCQSQKRFRFHKYQFIYMFFLYAIMSFTWMTVFDFRKYFSKKINRTAINNIDTKEHFIFWISKLLYVFFYVIIPVLFVGIEAWLIGFAIMHVTIGTTLSVVFQLA
ncbi:MAG: fatty acid desaturase family protein, partial [Ilyomonas sp.]